MRSNERDWTIFLRKKKSWFLCNGKKKKSQHVFIKLKLYIATLNLMECYIVFFSSSISLVLSLSFTHFRYVPITFVLLISLTSAAHLVHFSSEQFVFIGAVRYNLRSNNDFFQLNLRFCLCWLLSCRYMIVMFRIPNARKLLSKIYRKSKKSQLNTLCQCCSLSQLNFDMPSICGTFVVFLSSSIKFFFVHISRAHNDFISFFVYFFDIFGRCTHGIHTHTQ